MTGSAWESDVECAECECECEEDEGEEEDECGSARVSKSASEENTGGAASSARVLDLSHDTSLDSRGGSGSVSGSVSSAASE